VLSGNRNRIIFHLLTIFQFFPRNFGFVRRAKFCPPAGPGRPRVAPARTVPHVCAGDEGHCEDRRGPDWWGRHRWFIPFPEARELAHLCSFLFFFSLACASLFSCDHVDLVRNAKKLKWASAGCMAIPVISYYSQVQLISIWNQNWICIFPRKKKLEKDTLRASLRETRNCIL